MPYGVIKAAKTVEHATAWQTGKVPASLFPMHKPIPLTMKTRWRCLRLKAAEHDLRLLIMVRTDKNEFRAWLGEVVGSRLYVLACLEDHASHQGLHCHAPCERGLPSYSGSARNPEMRVAPSNACRRRRSHQWTEATAWREALKFFKVDNRPDGAML